MVLTVSVVQRPRLRHSGNTSMVVMDCVIIIYLISVYHGDPVIVVPMVF